MAHPRQLWVLAGGNGAGKSTFYHLFLAGYGLPFVNADLIARDLNLENPEDVSYHAYHATTLAGQIREDLISQAYLSVLKRFSPMNQKLTFLPEQS